MVGTPKKESLIRIIAPKEALSFSALSDPVVGQFEFVLKGHGFSRAVTAAKSIAALAAGGMCHSN
jgi:hypothetical protein